MKYTFDYIARWLSTNIRMLLNNTVIASIVLLLVSYAVKDGAFEEFTATKMCIISVLICNIWFGIFNSIGIFCSEQNYMLDDLTKFLPVRAYITGNVIIQFLQCLLEALVSACIFKLFFAYDTVGSVFQKSDFDYFLTFFLVLYCADMLGLLVGLIISGIKPLMSAVPILLAAQLLFSGCLFELNKTLDKIAYITTAKWGFYALGSIADLNSLLPPGSEFDYFSHSADYILYCWRYLILLTLMFIFLAGMALYFRINRMES